MKILYVENHRNNGDMMKQNLEFFGYDVILAHSGEEGIEMTYKEAPDVILMDLRMPGIGGLTAIKRLKDDPAVSSIPIIVLTAWGTKRNQEDAKKAGADNFLIKGVDINILVEAINKLSGSTK